MGAILEIGSSVNIAPIKMGMEDAEAAVRNAAAEIGGAFAGLAADSEKSVAQIASAWVTVAESSLAVKAAQSDVRSATRAAAEAEDGDTAALARLALAKRAAAVASATQTAAIKAATVGVVEEEGALAGLTERLIGSAEAAKLAQGSMAGFAGLAGLLGGGVLIGFFAHMEDEVAKSVVELGHLSTQTGIDIQTLAGLQQVVREMGGDFEGFGGGLRKMLRAQEEAVAGNAKAAAAFAHLGISIDDLKTLEPEALLYRLADGVQNVASHAVLADASTAIFGKGWATVIPVLRESGAELETLAHKAGLASGVTKDAAAAAREWTRDTAELSQMLRSFEVAALEPLLVLIKALKLGFEVMGVVAATVVRTLIQPFAAVAQGASDLSKVLRDTFSGNVYAVQGDVEQMKKHWVDSWKQGAADIEGYWARLKADRDAMFFAPPPPEEKKQTGLDVPEPGTEKPGKDSRLDDIEIKDQETHALALLEIERKRYEEEAKLRGDSALQIEAQLLAFNDRELKIKQNAIAQLRELDKQKNADERDATLAGQATAAEDHAALQRVEIAARANAQIVQDGKASEQALERVLRQLTEAQQREMAAESAEARKRLEERERDMREELSFEAEMNNRALEAAIKSDNDRVKHHQMTARQWEQAEVAAVEEWKARAIQILEQEAQQELAINGRETTEYKRLKDQEIEIAQQAANKIEQIQQQEEDKIAQTVAKAWQQMSNTIFNGINQWITHQKTFAQAMVQVWNGLVMDVVKQIEQIAAKQIEQNLIMTLANKIFGTQTTADSAGSNAAKIAQNSAANVSIGTSDAAVAGAAAFASVMEALPFPDNVVAAPEVAAAASGEGMGWASAAAFETGGIMPRTGMVLAHEKEGILPRPLTEMLLNTANNGGASGGSSQGGHTFHVNYQPVINHPVTRNDLDQHTDYLFARMRRMSNAFNS